MPPTAYLYVLILVQQTLAAITHFVARGAATSADPMLIVLLRGILATAIFLVWCYGTRLNAFFKISGRLAGEERTAPKSAPASSFWNSSWKLFERRDLPRFLLLGLVNIPGNQLLYITGVRYTIPPNAALAYALTPAAVLLIATLFYGERPSLLKVCGVGMAFVGAMIVLFEKGVDTGSAYFVGNCIELAAMLSWALFSVWGRELTVKYGAIPCVTASAVTGMLLYVPLFVLVRMVVPFEAQNGLLSGSSPGSSSGLQGIPNVIAYVATATASLSAELWWQIVYLAVFATCASFFLWFYVMGKSNASNIAVFSNVQPVLTTLIAVVVLGAVPSTMFFVGGAVVIAGVVLTQKT
jgi:drug/metabolite transporter (DMT)-like permease